MQTLVYAPDVTILIEHNGIQEDISRDIVRGQVVRRENSASSLFVTLANKDLRYNNRYSRMDRIVVYLTRTQRIQVFSGYIDSVPYSQVYPGTINIRATCTLKRLLHTWWNPALPTSQQFFNNLGASLGTNGDGQGGAISDTGMGAILRAILEQVGKWPHNTVHIQNFPQQFITFLNNYMATSNMQAKNQDLNRQLEGLILGSDLSPGPMGAVGYSAGDPVGTAASATNSGTNFYLDQIASAVDSRGMGSFVDTTANSATVQNTADILESATGQGGLADQGLAQIVHQAGQQLGQYSSNWSVQNQNSDAAILALAAAMVASGNGTPAIQMMANNAVPESLTFFHDGISNSGTGCGIFALPNDGTWGTVAQRMNPAASAGMFLDRLNAQTGWRNMDGGQAIWQVLQTASSNIPLYDAAIQVATPLVQAYRDAKQGAANAANAAIGSVGGGSILGAGANAIGSAAGNVVGAATTSPISAAAGVVDAGRPVPDSEGAINAAMSMVGTPYDWGGSVPHVGLDCSGMVMCAFGSIGIQIPHYTGAIMNSIPSVPLTNLQRGDILCSNYGGHTGIYLGGGMWIQTGGPGPMPGPVPVPTGPGGVMWAGRACGNGGANLAAPWTPFSGGAPGTGTPPGAGTGGEATGSASEPIARNLFSYIFEPDAYATSVADLFGGEKAYIDDQPLMQTIVAICSASLRNFQSAPNGDFIAYYPDPFGMDGKPAILALEDIELKDCHIDLSDQNLTTHVYVEGDYTLIGQADQATGWLMTSGVATVENSWLYKRLSSVSVGDIDSNMSAQQLMNRFGVRPYKNSYPVAGNAGLEFLLACQIFMGKWASQYETDIGLTYMPELYPGMRVLLVGHNLSVYCSAVTHEFDWQRGFSTTATVSAAANPQAAHTIYSSMPGFLNPVSTNPAGGGNTHNTGQPVAPTYQAPISGGPLDFQAGTYGTPWDPSNGLGGGNG